MNLMWIFVALLVLLLGGLGVFVFIILNRKKQEKVVNETKIHTTQEQLPFEYIRRGIVKLKNGQFIKLMEVPCINTQLMEEEEKEVVRETYASFLNSLDFPIQFYIQSRLVDINDYLAFLKDKETNADSDFRSAGIREYSRFIVELIKENSVQTKKDFLTLSYREVSAKSKKNSGDTMKKYRKGEEDEIVSEEERVQKEERLFEKAYKTLTQREKSLQKQLRRFGINPKSLNDKEAFELFYITYNKERSVYQSLKGVNPNNFTTLYVKQERGGE